MILADRLKKGDAIGIFSPSTPITAEVPARFRRAKEYMAGKGFNIIEGCLTYKKDYYRSGNIAERADELNALIRNPEVKCIMSTVGGMNSNSILPYIDYAQLASTPKVVIGYSDVTAILLAIYARIGLVTYYGPAMVASFGEFPPFNDLTYGYFDDITVNPGAVPYCLPRPNIWTDEFIPWDTQDRGKKSRTNALVTLNGGTAEGRLIGGNLNTMQGFWGSPYMPRIQEGDILFIEDSLKDIGTVERSFSFLKLNGVFEKISGLILGKHELFEDRGSGRKSYDVLKEVMRGFDIPVLAEFDCCHTHPMLTLPIGCTVQLDATNQKVALKERWIKD